MKEVKLAIEVNNAPKQPPLLLGAFMDDTYIDPIERRKQLADELCRELIEYSEHCQKLQSLRKKIILQKLTKANPKIEDLGRYVDLMAKTNRMKRMLRCMSSTTKSKRSRRTRRKLVLPEKTRQSIEEAGEDILCQAVQGMQLNSENSVRKSECMLLGHRSVTTKVDGRSLSKVAEDLSKLCMD